MYLRLVLVVAAGLIMSCGKDDTEIINWKSATELLTQQPWILTSYGTDHNKNGVIDESEENIQECQQDNIYTFNPNGTGLYSDNLLICANGITELPFDWSFSNQDTRIIFGAAEVHIMRLNENELVFFHEMGTPGESLKFISSYKHGM